MVEFMTLAAVLAVCLSRVNVFVEDREGRIDGQLAIYGQESNYNTWKLCKMNLAIRGIEANLGQQNADSFRNDQHKSLKADYIMANPPFNISDWGGERLIDDPRWSKYGIPPTVMPTMLGFCTCFIT